MHTSTFGNVQGTQQAKPRTATAPVGYPGMPNNMPLGARMGGASMSPSPTVRTDGSASGWSMPGSPTGPGVGGDVGPIGGASPNGIWANDPKLRPRYQDQQSPLGGGYNPWGQQAPGAGLPTNGMSTVQGGLPNSPYNPNATQYIPGMASAASASVDFNPGQSGLPSAMSGQQPSMPSSQPLWGQNLPGQSQTNQGIPANAAAMGTGSPAAYGVQSMPSSGSGGVYGNQINTTQSPMYGGGQSTNQAGIPSYGQQPFIGSGYEVSGSGNNGQFNRNEVNDWQREVDNQGRPIYDKNGKSFSDRRQDRMKRIAAGQFGGDDQAKGRYLDHGGEEGYDEWGNPLAGTAAWQGQQMRNAIRERQQRGY